MKIQNSMNNQLPTSRLVTHQPPQDGPQDRYEPGCDQMTRALEFTGLGLGLANGIVVGAMAQREMAQQILIEGFHLSTLTGSGAQGVAICLLGGVVMGAMGLAAGSSLASMLNTTK